MKLEKWLAKNHKKDKGIMNCTKCEDGKHIDGLLDKILQLKQDCHCSEVCKWTLSKNFTNCFTTGCGIIISLPPKNKKYCTFCGGKIKEEA